MDSINFFHISLFVLQCILVGGLLLTLFRLRTIMGMGLLFTALGVFQYMQVFLTNTLSIKIAPGIIVSQGTGVLFSGSLFTILLIYIREDALEARKVIYAIFAANIVLSFLQYIFAWSLGGDAVINIYNLPAELFVTNGRIILSGTIAFIIDAIVLMMLFEYFSRHIVNIFFRILFTMIIVLSVDSLLFSLGGFYGTDLFTDVLTSGLISKNSAAVVYSLLFSFYLVTFEKDKYLLPKLSGSFDDIFSVLTYRQKYEMVSKEKKEQMILSEHEKRDMFTLLKAISDTTTDVIYVKDIHGRYRFVNEAGAAFLGLRPDQIQGKTDKDLFTEETALKMQESDTAILLKGVTQTFDQELTNTHGIKRFFSITLGPYSDVNGQVLGLIGTSRDITARKQSEFESKEQYDISENARRALLSIMEDQVAVEESLRESEELFSTIFASSPIPFSIANISDGKLIKVNDAWCKFMGFSREELVGFNVGELNIIDQEERSKLREEILRKGSFRLLESEITTKSGEKKSILTSANIISIRGEQFSINLVIDVTVRKLAELALLEAKNVTEKSFFQLTMALQASLSGYYELNFITGVATCSKEFEEIYGMQPGELSGKNMKEWELCIVAEDLQHVRADIQRTITNDDPITSVFRIRRRDNNEIRRIEARGRIVYDSDRRPLQMIGINTDITERTKAVEEIHLRAKELAALNALGRNVNISLSMDEVISSGLNGILESVKPDMAFFFLRDGDRLIQKKIVPAEAKIRLGDVPEHRVGECMCGLAVREKKAMYSRDIFKDMRCTWEECKKAGIRSFAALPLLSVGEVIGVIGLASDEERDFEVQADFLETLTSTISISLSNAFFYEQIQIHAADLELRVKERTERLEAANKELEELNDVFVGRESRIIELKEEIKKLKSK